jgi:hypothetical protein
MAGKPGPRSKAMHDDATDSQGRTLIFLHIPKTAGTTLNRFIEKQYNPLRIYTIPGGYRVWSIERFKRLSDRRRSRLRVLRGHMGFGLHRFFSQPSTYMTVLREPVNQVTSSYYYALSNRFHPLHSVLSERRVTLERFPDLAPWGNNLQTKLVGGMSMARVNPPAALAAARRGEMVSPEEFAGEHCTPEILAAAKRNLESSFSVVGLTERFDESLALMTLSYGWRATAYQRFRKSKKRPVNDALTSSVRRRLERENAYDIELYDFGRQLFERSVERNREAVDRVLERLRAGTTGGRALNAARGGAAWARAAVSLLRSAT